MQSGRCQMMTQRGTQCLRLPTNGTYCTQHSTCSVCLSTISNGISRTLPCNHVFHVDCIDRWKQRSSTCPMCRAPFDQPQYKVSVSVQHVPTNNTYRDSYVTGNVSQLFSTFNIPEQYITNIFFDIGMHEFIEDVFREVGLRLPSAIEREQPFQHHSLRNTPNRTESNSNQDTFDPLDEDL